MAQGQTLLDNFLRKVSMKKTLSLLIAMAAIMPNLAMAEAAPTIDGAASVDADITGGVINAGAVSGGKATIEQSVASIKSGTIEGAVKISADIIGGVVNAGAVSAGTATIKQSVATMLDGSVSGALTDSLSLKGGIVNAGEVSGGEADIEQSIGTVGNSDN